MKDVIVKELAALEEKENIKILFAAEAGSRAWGFPSPDSDYDVRFIYTHPVNWYLSIDDRRETIELPINDVLDIGGWDIRKALRLLRNSNAPLIEWLTSSLVYVKDEGFHDDLVQLIPEFFSPKATIHHYLSMAKNALEHVQKPEVKLKKYFYAIRSALACRWIYTHDTFPPVPFEDLRQLVPDTNMQALITRLMDEKLKASEGYEIRMIEELNDFISAELKEAYSHSFAFTKKKGDSEKLDELFRRYIA